MAGCVARRFWSKADRTDPSGCWLWTAAVDEQTGYGRLGIGTRSVAAHRIAFELFVGPIPDGMVIDHLCRVRRCVNPDHLEAVSQRENLLRGDTLTAAHASDRDCGFDGCKNCQRFRVSA